VKPATEPGTPPEAGWAREVPLAEGWREDQDLPVGDISTMEE